MQNQKDAIKAKVDAVLAERGAEILAFINSRIFKSLRDKVNAQEILAEAVCYVLERPEKVLKRDKDHLYLYIIWKAKLLVCDKARREKRSVFEDTPSSDEAEFFREPTTDARFSPTYILHRKTKEESLQEVIATVENDDYRRLLQLVRIEGYSIDEAAAIMGKSPAATRTMLWRAFEKLVSKVKHGNNRKFETSGETT